jgi:drug/metabolite transporter (DMT)-like permease
MNKRLSSHRETMALALMVWLCSLPLVALFVFPFFGFQTAAAVALAIFLLLMALCWGLCGRAT